MAIRSINLYYEWNSGSQSWDVTDRVNYTYTGNLLTSYIFEYYDGGAWVKDLMITHSYNTNGVLTGYEFFGWDAGTQTWKPSSRTTNTLGGAGQILTRLIEQWSNGANAYENQNKAIYTYDGNLDNIELVYQQWNSSAAIWENMEQSIYSYNNYHMVKMWERLLWDAPTSSWQVSQGSFKEQYWFEQYTTGVAKTTAIQGEFMIFPTVTANNIHIQILNGTPQRLTGTVYDMQGRQVMQWNDNTSPNYHKRIDVSQLAAGTYNLTIRTATGVETQRFVVSK